eukprot:TRINITY_DN7009_c0_g1_i1.p1 TRINITY_DN7009_c0_g1~~TRINITY_DN7009_c0_g1_i1.p1  ORF type:complete len:298 (-),score=59.22 TRINITY_DN7009_c0_g1_i1:3-896(-)
MENKSEKEDIPPSDETKIAVPHDHRKAIAQRKRKKKKNGHGCVLTPAKENPNLLAKRRLDFLIQNNYQDLPYVEKWLKQDFLPQIRADINFYSILNHKQLKKEMTESYSIYRQVKKLIKQIGDQTSKKEIVLFDVCSGKGFSSILLSFRFPNARIHMIDSCKVMNVSHLKSMPNVTLDIADIFAPSFEGWVKERCEGKLGIFLGTHLCGNLSERFITVFRSVPDLRGMILAPCCLSGKMNGLVDGARRLKVDPYKYWCLYLHLMLGSGVRKDLSHDDNILSDKNCVILASKYNDGEE